MISNYFEIFLLSIVQGISEFLPISSAAHLILVSNIYEFKNQSLLIDISLHLGSLLAILFYFRKDIFDFNKILSFDAIKATYQDIQILINKNYILYYSAFFILYVVVTAFGLPISLIKTLLAGALFGFWPGLILVSFASSIGSTFCFLFSR